MPKRSVLITVALLIGILGLLYGFIQGITVRIALPLAAAFGLEAGLYVLPGLAATREALRRRVSKPAAALWITLSAAAPYCLYAIPDGVFQWGSLAGIAGLAALLSLWYVVLPRSRAADLAFVALVAAAILANPFDALYGSPVPRLALSILGQLMWTRVAITAALVVAGMEVKGFGFLPTRQEWRVGVLHFAMFVPVGALAGWATGFARFHLRPWEWWQAAAIALGTFLGMLWVVALREEFFFRGLLQQWLAEWLRNRWVALAVASVLFGALHLPFRRFPNWRFALLATLAGLFYGRAYMTGRSVRAAMVTHALVNTVWKVLF